MKNFKEMSFAECMEFSKNNLSEELFPAEVYACDHVLDAYVIRCHDTVCGVTTTWFHFFVLDCRTGEPFCFRAVDSKKRADKLWEWYTRAD